MNDTTNLYLVLKIARPTTVYGSILMEFDNDNDGIKEAGDDLFFISFSPGSLPAIYDIYRYPCTNAPPTSGGCESPDESNGGTMDVVGGAANSEGFTIFEISRPLNNTDDAHDFSLNLGDKVGFRLTYQEIVGDAPDGFGTTLFPSDGFGEITLMNPVIPVSIDISPSNISLKNPNKVKVAVLTTPSFNADLEVNPNSIRFGVKGTNALPLPGQSRKADVDGDGDLDWVFQFAVANTGIICTSTEARLTGKTIGGTSIEGTATIRTIGCR